MTKPESRRGKAFEELVARMETTLASHGSIVTSPDFIRDKITNRMREVDASIRIPDGDSTRLITVECRDHRKGKQDDRWIEQLVTKREKIGASLTVAVSSSGFSESAIISAKHFGIALRRLDEITDAEIAQAWAGLSKFRLEGSGSTPLMTSTISTSHIMRRSSGNTNDKHTLKNRVYLYEGGSQWVYLPTMNLSF